jgi:hypothetical protein
MDMPSKMASPSTSGRCPHCNAFAALQPDNGGYRCALCGGPRILVETDVPRPGGEAPLLREARRLGVHRIAWAVGSSIATAAAVISALIALGIAALFGVGATGALALGVLALMPLVFALYGWKKVGALSRQSAAKLDEARVAVAREVIAAHAGRIEPRALSQILRVPEDSAIQLIAEAQVEQLLQPEPVPAGRRVRVDVEEPFVDEADTAASQSRSGPSRSARPQDGDRKRDRRH